MTAELGQLQIYYCINLSLIWTRQSKISRKNGSEGHFGILKMFQYNKSIRSSALEKSLVDTCTFFNIENVQYLIL